MNKTTSWSRSFFRPNHKAAFLQQVGERSAITRYKDLGEMRSGEQGWAMLRLGSFFAFWFFEKFVV